MTVLAILRAKAHNAASTQRNELMHIASKAAPLATPVNPAEMGWRTSAYGKFSRKGSWYPGPAPKLFLYWDKNPS